jgi:protein-disulfide isomerase
MGLSMIDLAQPVTDHDQARGPSAATVTLVEYGDFECPFCARAFPVVRELQRTFPDDLRFVFRHNPIGREHPHAHLAAQASEAAALQGHFWPMHDSLFERQDALEERDLVERARSLGLDLARFERDLRSHPVIERVHEDEVGAVRSRVIGTPTFFVNGVHFREKPDLEDLSRAIEAGRGGVGVL